MSQYVLDRMLQFAFRNGHMNLSPYILKAPIPHMVDIIFQNSKNLNEQQYFTDNHFE